MYRSFLTIATRLPSPPSTTSARADSRPWNPYDGFLVVACWLGSSNGFLGSRSCADWPAEPPTWQGARTPPAAPPPPRARPPPPPRPPPSPAGPPPRRPCCPPGRRAQARLSRRRSRDL